MSSSLESVSPSGGDHSPPHDKSLNLSEKKAGRRKINIEFIDDKSRRHITFSKRKAGIMKKAYELSALTGTQVLLLVASETGHVYTFATPKLQPLITKPEGKNLIQTCLNAPDAPQLHSNSNPHSNQRAPPASNNSSNSSSSNNNNNHHQHSNSNSNNSSSNHNHNNHHNNHHHNNNHNYPEPYYSPSESSTPDPYEKKDVKLNYGAPPPSLDVHGYPGSSYSQGPPSLSNSNRMYPIPGGLSSRYPPPPNPAGYPPSNPYPHYPQSSPYSDGEYGPPPTSYGNWNPSPGPKLPLPNLASLSNLPEGQGPSAGHSLPSSGSKM